MLDRAPIEGASVRWQPADGEATGGLARGASARTDSQGSFRLVQIPKGEQRLLIERDGKSFHALGLPSRDRWPVSRGRAFIEAVPPGNWTIIAETPDGQSWQTQLRIAGQAALEIELR